MKKIIISLSFFLSLLFIATPVFAQTATTGGVSQIQSFIQSVVQVLITLAGAVSIGFFVWGGYGYSTSSGNPEKLDRSKSTIWHSAIGLAIVLGAFVLSNVITQLATAAFGASK